MKKPKKKTSPKKNPIKKVQKTREPKKNTKWFSRTFDYLSDNLMYALMASVVIFPCIPMFLPFEISEEKQLDNTFDVLGYYENKLPQIPVLQSEEGYPVVSARSVYALDLRSGISLYEKNPDQKLFPASTTKIITSLVALDYYDLNQELLVGEFSVEGQKMGLIPGEKIRVEDILYGLLVFSGNDAAEVIARNYDGGRSRFIENMNLLAKDLGLENSHFANPSGLDDATQVTTAKDLATAGRHAMKNPLFAKIVSTKEKTVEGSNGIGVHKLKNINQLVGSVDGVMGIKTGWTQNARENLVTFVERDGKPIILVVLGSQDRFSETQEIIEWVYSNFEWIDVSDIYSEVDGSSEVLP